MKTTPTLDPLALAHAALDRGVRPFDDDAVVEALAAQLAAPGFEDQLDALLVLESVTTLLRGSRATPELPTLPRCSSRRSPLAAAAAAALIVALALGTWRQAPTVATTGSSPTPFLDQLAVAQEAPGASPELAERVPSRVTIRSLAITIERDRETSPFAASRPHTKTTHSTLTPR